MDWSIFRLWAGWEQVSLLGLVCLVLISCQAAAPAHAELRPSPSTRAPVGASKMYQKP